MPSIITHPAVALTRSWFPRVPRRAVVAAVFGTIAPDLDVAAFALGIPYNHPLGHRGLTHSIAFALLYSLLASLVLRTRESFPFLFLCTMSHAVLDAMTNGGLGVAFFAPFSNARYFLPWTPIRVSPIGAGFFSARGLETLVSECLWVWLPCGIVSALGRRRH
ncbi:MAG TPA: metal-dependent hydrolase [Thermoanaerobaculia bacterium]|jgi:inner membrane protein|nr:metal-dependent hydrolase [Thermoanaerobaculia bacterium]